FGRRLVKQYEIARDVHGFAPAGLAELARMSIRGSAAPPDTRARVLSAIDDWLAPGANRVTGGRRRGWVPGSAGRRRRPGRPRRSRGPAPGDWPSWPRPR